jgi:hypothetical protein
MQCPVQSRHCLWLNGWMDKPGCSPLTPFSDAIEPTDWHPNSLAWHLSSSVVRSWGPAQLCGLSFPNQFPMLTHTHTYTHTHTHTHTHTIICPTVWQHFPAQNYYSSYTFMFLALYIKIQTNSHHHRGLSLAWLSPVWLLKVLVSPVECVSEPIRTALLITQIL